MVYSFNLASKEFGDRERVTMKHIQLETRIDSTFLPELYSTATESSEVRELRVIDWNLAADASLAACALPVA
jgi:hypothetical protein